MQSSSRTVHPRPAVAIATAAWLGLTSLACGTLYDIGGGSSSVNVSGTIASVIIANAARDIQVFVYTDLCQTDDADPAICDDLQLPEDLPALTDNEYRSMETARVSGNGKFTVKGSKKGALTVAFLQDDADDPDQTIDAEDITVTRDGQGQIVAAADNAVAMLAPAGILNDARKNVNLEAVDVDFPNATADSPVTTTTSTSSTSSSSVTGPSTPSTTNSTLSTTTTLGPG